jgi:hypothetical protein
MLAITLDMHKQGYESSSTDSALQQLHSLTLLESMYMKVPNLNHALQNCASSDDPLRLHKSAPGVITARAPIFSLSKGLRT